MIKAKKYTILILLFLLLAFIFYMSSNPVDQSAQMSYEIDRWLCGLFVPDYEALPYESQTSLAIGLDFWVRKSAHFLEYAALGALVYFAAGLFLESERGRFLLSLCAGTVWAATDEFHQYFVPGRSCELRDVMIDAAGVLTGAAAAVVVKKYKNYKSNCDYRTISAKSEKNTSGRE